MSAAYERFKAMKAARADFDKALPLAENVSDAWYRSQALAAVARFAPDGEVARVAKKALQAATLAGDAYKRVAVSAWAVCALAERGKVQYAQETITSLLEEAQRIEPPVSKISALAGLWYAVWSLPVAVKRPVQEALVSACLVTNSWKAGRIMRDIALLVGSEDKEQAQGIIDLMRESAYRRQAQKRLDAGQLGTAPSFFP